MKKMWFSFLVFSLVGISGLSFAQQDPWDHFTRDQESPTADGKWDNAYYLSGATGVSPKILEMPSPCGKPNEVVRICIGHIVKYKRPSSGADGYWKEVISTCNTTVTGDCPSATKCNDSSLLSLKAAKASSAKEIPQVICQPKTANEAAHNGNQAVVHGTSPSSR